MHEEEMKSVFIYLSFTLIYISALYNIFSKSSTKLSHQKLYTYSTFLSIFYFITVKESLENLFHSTVIILNVVSFVIGIYIEYNYSKQNMRKYAFFVLILLTINITTFGTGEKTHHVFN
jgi:hypothetical protein